MIKSCTEPLEGEERSNCAIEFEEKYIPMEQITPKIIYKLSVGSKYNPPTARDYFSRQFQIIDPDTWKSIYLLPRKETVGNKIRMFQYKILNNILYLNQGLYFIRVSASHGKPGKPGKWSNILGNLENSWNLIFHNTKSWKTHGKLI